MEKKNNTGLIIILVLVTALVAFAGGYIVKDMMTKPETKTEEKKEEQKEETTKISFDAFVSSKIEERKDALISSDSAYTLEITKEGNVLLTTNIEERDEEEDAEILHATKKEILSDVIAYKITQGEGPTCLGGRNVHLLTSDGSISSISMDELECGHTLQIEKENINLKDWIK